MRSRLLADSLTMFRRSLRRMRRYPSLTFFVAAIPVILLLLFVYVLGGTLGSGLAGPGIGAGHVPILAHSAESSPEFRLVPVSEVLGKR